MSKKLSQQQLNALLEQERAEGQQLRELTSEDSFLKTLGDNFIQAFEQSFTGHSTSTIKNILLLPFVLFGGFFKYFGAVILRFLLLNVIAYLIIVSPLMFMAYKVDWSPPITLWLPVTTLLNIKSLSIFGIIMSAFQDLKFLILHNFPSLLILCASLVTLRGPLILITRTPMLMLWMVINLSALIMGAFGHGELWLSIKDISGREAFVHELFVIPPMFLSLFMTLVTLIALVIRPQINSFLNVNMSLNAFGEDKGSFFSTLFGLNGLRSNTISRGFRMSEDEKPKMDWSIPLFYDGMEMLISVLHVRWRLLLASLLILISSGAYYGTQLKYSGPSLFSMAPAERKLFFRKECISNAPNMSGINALSGTHFMPSKAKQSNVIAPDFFIFAKDSVNKLRQKYFQANSYIQHYEVPIVQMCNEDVMSTVIVFERLKEQVGLDALLNPTGYQKAFNNFLGQVKDIDVLKKKELVPVVYQAVFEIAHNYRKTEIMIKTKTEIRVRQMEQKREQIRRGEG